MPPDRLRLRSLVWLVRGRWAFHTVSLVVWRPRAIGGALPFIEVLLAPSGAYAEPRVSR